MSFPRMPAVARLVPSCSRLITILPRALELVPKIFDLANHAASSPVLAVAQVSLRRTGRLQTPIRQLPRPIISTGVAQSMPYKAHALGQPAAVSAADLVVSRLAAAAGASAAAYGVPTNVVMLSGGRA